MLLNHIFLSFPNAPLATALEKGQTNYYPMELCKLRDNQRAQLSQLSQREVAAMIKVLFYENFNCLAKIIFYFFTGLRRATSPIEASNWVMLLYYLTYP